MEGKLNAVDTTYLLPRFDSIKRRCHLFKSSLLGLSVI